MRPFPLFIIDTDRSHGRGRELDFVSCTSKEIPFVAVITLLNKAELAIDQDWAAKNYLCVYSDENAAGIRAKLKVVDYPRDADTSKMQSLMRRGMKEWLIRRKAATVDMTDISDEVVVKFCETLLEQTRENLRENPNDSQAKMVAGILTKIKNDYK